MLLLQHLSGLVLIILVYGDYCPIVFNPPEVVVEHGGSFSVNCSTTITDHLDLSWEPNKDTGEGFDEISTSVDEVIDWENNLTCYILFNGTQCSQNLPVTIYKTPDRVSIMTVNHTGPMTEGKQYKLQCDVHNVAPVQNLIIKWYKGLNLVNQTTFTDTIKTPVSETATLLISPDRDDDGDQYRCEAELELGEEGPQPPPTVTSDPLSITVHYYCPIVFNPPEVVVEHGGSFSVNCSTTITDHLDLSWEPNKDTGEGFDEISTSVDEVIDWENNLTCYILFNGTQCSQNLPVTIYKTPDRVSIMTVDHTGPMMEGKQYKLQCDVHNVAPVQNLTVRWYKGLNLVNQTTFTDTIKTPVSETATLLISPDRDDDGDQYRCEAELELGEEGPQPPPTVISDPLSITVHYGQCPLQLNPRSAVVRYGGSVSVICNSSVPHDGMGWEASVGAVPMNNNNLTKWRVSNLTDWNIEPPFCFINYNNDKQCQLDLPVTVYQPPDRVSIMTVNHTGPMMEGKQYKLQCDVHNVAPVQNLIIKWYKGPNLVDQTTFTDTIKTPVSETATLLISPDRDDDGDQYRCEAELELGEEGLQPPPTVISDPLSITVHYAPMIYTRQELFFFQEENNITLNCKSSGNPAPDMWLTFKNKNITTRRRQHHITKLIEGATSTNAGVYTCSATNEFGSNHKTFTVEIRDKSPSYIPIAVGLVALLVFLFLLIIFLWRRKKSSGRYEIQPVKQCEMQPLSNGGPK